MLYILSFFAFLILFLVTGKLKIKLPIEQVIIISLLVRALIIILFPKSQSEDLTSFLTAGEIILKKKSIYPVLYFPFMPYIGYSAFKLKTVINPLILLKIFFSLFDVGIVYLIYLISNNLTLALIYGLNPITLLNTTIHGQFDTIPLFFLVLAIYLFIKRKNVLSILSLSFGVYTKTWPFLFSPPILRKLKNKWVFALVALFPALSILIYWKLNGVNPIQILTPIKNYRGLYGFWGITELTNFWLPHLDAGFIQLMRRFFLISFLIYSLVFPFTDVVGGITIQMLFFFIFTTTYGVQWLTWLTPFIILTKIKYQKIFFISATIYLVVVYYRNVYKIPIPGTLFYNIELMRKFIGLGIWAIVILMFRQLVYQRGSRG